MAVVGVLGLQGDFARHEQSLSRIGVTPKNVRYPEDLEVCGGLILPGGESTTFIKLLKKTGLFEAIRDFGSKKPLMGTCAGLITLSTRVANDGLDTLGLINITAERNAYGRQVDSFIDDIALDVFPDKPKFEGVFIRAPKIVEVGEGVEVLGRHGDEMVMARNERVLVMTFHPELTRDTRIHRYFVEQFIG